MKNLFYVCTSKITPKLIIGLISVLVVPGIIFGASRTYSHFQVKHIVDEAKILGASDKHEEAINVLLLAGEKWATKSLKEEVASEIEKNKGLLEETQAGEIQLTESPTPTSIPNSIPTLQIAKPQTETPISTLTPTPTSQTTSQAMPQPEVVYIIEDRPAQQDQPTQDYKAACELELQRLLAEHEATEQRYEQYLKDITQPIIDAQVAEFTRRGIPLSSGVYEQAVANAIAPYVERNRLDKEGALRQIEYQINYLLEIDPNCKDLI